MKVNLKLERAYLAGFTEGSRQARLALEEKAEARLQQLEQKVEQQAEASFAKLDAAVREVQAERVRLRAIENAKRDEGVRLN